MKKFLATVVGALILINTPAYAIDEVFTEQVLNPVVNVNDNCSGTIYQSESNSKSEIITKVLTAKHCVKDDEFGKVIFQVLDKEGKLVEKREVFFDKDYESSTLDIATLELRDKSQVYPVANLASEIVAQQGDDVYTVGFPLALHKTITKGSYNGWTNFEETGFPKKVRENPFIQATPPVAPGNSGGALFQKNGDNYELIGVTSAGFMPYVQTGLYVPIDGVLKALRIKPDTVEIKLPPLPELE